MPETKKLEKNTLIKNCSHNTPHVFIMFNDYSWIDENQILQALEDVDLRTKENEK